MMMMMMMVMVTKDIRAAAVGKVITTGMRVLVL